MTATPPLKRAVHLEKIWGAGLSPAVAHVGVRGIATNHRGVEDGYIFVGLSGANTHGKNFAKRAVAKGAVAVVMESPVFKAVDVPAFGAPESPAPAFDTPGVDVPVLLDKNPRRRLALMAANFYKTLAQQDKAPRIMPQTIVAVTGTNGKTSVVEFTRQLWQRSGVVAGSLGTLGLRGGGEDASDGRRKNHGPALTTLDPLRLHETLYGLACRQVTHLAMEASSHALAQHRLDAVRLQAAGITNLSHDHLDYHGSVKAYGAAKLRLFTEILPTKGVAVMNADGPVAKTLGASMSSAVGGTVFSFGRRGEDLRLERQVRTHHGTKLWLSCRGWRTTVHLAMVGRFQVENALCACALVIACGGDVKETLRHIETLTPPPGRLELVACLPCKARVVVDYAHTPQALKSALMDLRHRLKGKLVLVFGCGGERDTAKRATMGRVAQLYADEVIVTDDNPRHEDAGAIRSAIMATCPKAREVASRGRAIEDAMAGLRQGDLLLIAGKGHENTMEKNGEFVPFNDADVVREIAGLGAGGGV